MSELSADRSAGLEGRYRVEKINDSTGKHNKCRYFVLDPQHDPLALQALKHYARLAREEYPALAADLREWAQGAACHCRCHMGGVGTACRQNRCEVCDR